MTILEHPPLLNQVFLFEMLIQQTLSMTVQNNAPVSDIRTTFREILRFQPIVDSNGLRASSDSGHTPYGYTRMTLHGF